MENSDHIKEQILNEVQKLADDSRYQNEEYPAKMFRQHAKQYLGIEVSELIENKNDPPDFFVNEAGTRVNLEITNLSKEIIFQRNSFFQLIESIAKPLIEQYLDSLPHGTYSIHFSPGSLQETNIAALKIDVIDFSHSAGKIQIENQLKRRILEAFSRFKTDSTLTEDTISVTDKNGNRVGEIRILKYEGNEKNYIFWPLRMRKNEPWKHEELGEAIQLAVSKKEEKYTKMDEQKIGHDPWWLLISDIYNKMGTGQAEFDISKIIARTNFFQRVFMIQDILRNYRIIQIKIEKG